MRGGDCFLSSQRRLPRSLFNQERKRGRKNGALRKRGGEKNFSITCPLVEHHSSRGRKKGGRAFGRSRKKETLHRERVNPALLWSSRAEEKRRKADTGKRRKISPTMHLARLHLSSNKKKKGGERKGNFRLSPKSNSSIPTSLKKEEGAHDLQRGRKGRGIPFAETLSVIPLIHGKGGERMSLSERERENQGRTCLAAGRKRRIWQLSLPVRGGGGRGRCRQRKGEKRKKKTCIARVGTSSTPLTSIQHGGGGRPPAPP